MRYDPRATPELDTITDGKPCYVPLKTVQALVATPGAWRSVWRVAEQVTTVETWGHAMVRPWEAWGPDLEAGVRWWTARKMRAPSSPAGMLRDAASEWYRPATWTSYGWALPYLRGGWQEATVRGVILGPHRMYDLRRAYRWALTAADLPDRHQFRIACAWRPRWPGLHLVDCDPWPGAPWPLRDGGRVLVETPVDVERYGPPPMRSYLGGVYWHGTVSAAPLAELIDSTGVSACARTYWGTWIAQTPVTRTCHTGTVTQLRPRGTDAVRAHLILARVRRRMAAVQADYRYVDSVITTQQMQTGDQVGDWRLVREYPKGIWIGWPGSYGAPGAPPDKHAGIKHA